MHRDYVTWWSPSLGREMELLVFGHAGTPILVFPSSQGRFYEWEDFGMVGALADKLEAGHNLLVCVDSVDRESFFNRGADPYTRIKRHQQYEGYILGEVMPFMKHRAQNDYVIATGASFGAYHAANLVFKRPWDFGKLIALSGVYDVRRFFDGFYNQDVYFSNPVDFLPNLHDGAALDALRRTQIVLTTGEYDPCKDANLYMSHLLNQKGIPHHLEFVGGAFGHDWPWWFEQIRRFVV